jgi:tetratricopeptide (TPR) repeat protein
VGTVVVYVHGLWLWGGESFLLRRRLSRGLGAECRTFSYPSVSASIDENAAALGAYLGTLRAETLHLVAHSMGGLVILKMFDLLGVDARALPPGRVVFTGSPVRGSLSAERLVRLPLGRLLLGRSGGEVLLDHSERRWTGGRQLGVIAGDRAAGMGRLLGSLDGPSDGTVALSETDLPGASDSLRLHVSHSGMVFSREVARQVAAFLLEGRFDHGARRSPLEQRRNHAEPGDSFEAVYARGATAVAAGDLEGALVSYDLAIAMNPSHAEAYYKRGNTLKNLGRLEAALASYDQAIERRPDFSFSYCNRGVVQQALGRTVEALASYDYAIQLDPLDAVPHYNRALLLQENSRWEEALASYDRAIAINPEFAEAQYNRAMALLFLGDFERGWRSYEWRWKNARLLGIGEQRHFVQPLWLGEESIAGKRLLLHSEAGLGDTLQFCRYAPLAAAQGASVYVEVPAALVRILANLDGVEQLIAEGSPLPDFDYHCPLMSLPLAFKTTLQTIPNTAEYLNSDQTRVANWQKRLRERTGPRVGLVWSGNPSNTIDPRRTIRLAELAAHLPRNFQYFSLQKDVRTEDLPALAANQFIIPFDSTLDFIDTAALCECMDVVVTVDTSVAHLSAALGQRTWILLPFTPDWRWMRDREDSPWYRSVKLYRQRVAGEWGDVFERLVADLRREFGG